MIQRDRNRENRVETESEREIQRNRDNGRIILQAVVSNLYLKKVLDKPHGIK